MNEPADEHHRRGRYRTIPAPPPRMSEQGRLPGSSVLAEFDGAPPHVQDLGVPIWATLRAVLLWADTPADRRQHLFVGLTDTIRERLALMRRLAAELEPALAPLADMYGAAHLVAPSALADACAAIQEWADDQGLITTAVQFAEAAAGVEPTNAARAIAAGRICNRAGGAELVEHAECWFERAFALARRSPRGGKLLAIRALLNHGDFLKDRGRLEDARDLYERAARRARRYERWKYLAVAEHHLLGLTAESGPFEVAIDHARRALDHYARHAPRLPYLVHDVAFLLIRHRHYSRALPLLQRLHEAVRPRDQILACSTLAWALAACGHADRFRLAERNTLQLADRYTEFAPAAMIHLAHGARFVGDWEKAVEYARDAARRAAERREPELEQEALELAAALKDREAAPGEVELRSGAAEPLLRLLAARIRAWRARREDTAQGDGSENRGGE